MGDFPRDVRKVTDMIIGASKRVVRDAFGREVGVGDLVMLPNLPSQTFRIMQITPNMDPSAPPHAAMKVVVYAQIVLAGPANLPVADIVRVVTAAEQKLPAPAEPTTSPQEN